ncbi:solute:sodium symporter family transporter [Chryseobacterium rhizosphaerae]|uniref:SSS family solute:Na+ symporter n=1 Tax=Chryseobacterium rhizosphaerae TaxID=395937 RepID=A0AAE3YDV5_9FLAO|nr:solute:sodium symporter family transporter [Chryseobacterium rhizosphaerae]MDR6528341.1 SSS family solute:Na+ symporter [Chryseobacterium rhizosphaerae]
MLTTLITFFIFTAGVAFISWRFTRKTKMAHSSIGYFLGGRDLNAILITASLLLTNLSTEHLVGLNGSAYAFGMEVMAWETLAALALVLMAVYFLPRYLKMGLVTITEFLELRYDKQTRVICSGLFLLLYITTLLPIVLYTGAITMESIFNVSENLHIDKFTAMVIMVVGIGILGSLYAILGGLKAVAISDLINGIGLIIGGSLIPILAFYKIGDGSFSNGVHTVFEAVPDRFNAIGESTSDVPFSVLFTGMFIPQVFYWTMNQSIIQRAFAAKNLAEGQKGVLLTAFFKIFIPFVVVVPGIIAYYYFKNSLNDPDYAYPELVKAVLPVGLIGIFAAIVVGAILSTFNGALNSASTLFSIDIYKGYFNQKATETEIVKFGKKCGTVMAIASMVIAPFISMAGKGLYIILQEFSSIFNMPIFAIIIAGLLLPKVSAKAAKIGLITGTLLYLFSKFGMEAMGFRIHFLHRLAVAFVVTILTLIIASRYYPRENNFVIEDTGAVNVENWKYLKPACIFIAILTILVFLFFSPIGIIPSQ